MMMTGLKNLFLRQPFSSTTALRSIYPQNFNNNFVFRQQFYHSVLKRNKRDILLSVQYDIMLSDITSDDVKGEVSKILGVVYLEETKQKEETLEEMTGIVWGLNWRVFVSMPVQIAKKRKDVIFIVDTGSQATFLCQEAINKLGCELSPKVNYINCRINGEKIIAYESPIGSHFENLNVLGANYFVSTVGKLLVDYETMTAKINIKNK